MSKKQYTPPEPYQHRTVNRAETMGLTQSSAPRVQRKICPLIGESCAMTKCAFFMQTDKQGGADCAYRIVGNAMMINAKLLRDIADQLKKE